MKAKKIASQKHNEKSNFYHFINQSLMFCFLKNPMGNQFLALLQFLSKPIICPPTLPLTNKKLTPPKLDSQAKHFFILLDTYHEKNYIIPLWRFTVVFSIEHGSKKSVDLEQTRWLRSHQCQGGSLPQKRRVNVLLPFDDHGNGGCAFHHQGHGQRQHFQNYMVALPDGPLKNFHLGAGYEIPVYQQLEGIQMKTKSLLTFGVQCSFKAKKEKEE